MIARTRPLASGRTRRDPEHKVRRSHRSRSLSLPCAIVVLILAMFGPLMGGGVVLHLDSPVNLIGPYPRAAIAVGPLPPELAARAPVDALLVALYRALPWGQVRLLPVIAAVVLAAWGFARLFAGRRLAIFGATLLYATNPFMYERIVVGQDLLVLGYSLLPLLLSALWAAPTRRRILTLAVVSAAAAALSLHLVFVAGVLCATFLVTDVVRRRSLEARTLVLGGALAAACSLYWIVQAVAHWGRLGVVPVTDLSLFRSTPDPHLGLAANLAGLYGFWRQGWPLPKDGLPGWPVLLVALWAVMAAGLANALRDERRRERFLPVLVAGLIGLALAAGDQGPAGGAYAWMFAHVPLVRIMREPQKWLVLLALAYAVAFGEGVDAIQHAVRGRNARVAAALVVVAIPAAYGFSSFWGSGGYVRPSAYPASWAQADAVMGEGPGLVVALPWHRYLALPWAQDRVVSDPMASAFRRGVIVSADPEFTGLASAGRDPLADGVGELLDEGAAGRQVADDLRELGIRYLLLAKVDDWMNSAWLLDQDAIVVARSWDDLVLFQIRPPPEP